MSISDYVEERLIRIGATPEYTGHKYLVQGIIMSMQDESLLNRVTTGLYPAIAEKYNTGAANVERSIRTVISAIWCEADNKELRDMMGRSYLVQPGNAKFIGILSKHFLIDYRRSQRRSEHRAHDKGENTVAKESDLC
ncbi:MAG: sporulation initiation factor Spo0A C-terminal domain-containing protein [Clostridia bacterium]|nr:sporulation initiation factor Spo0A C-terminal domain-containing protein [Clostridia bacterium]